MKNKESVDRITVEKAIRASVEKIRDSLGKAGYRAVWDGKGGTHDLECYAGGKRGVLIIQKLRDYEGFLTGVDVFAPLTQSNSMQETLDAIEDKPSRLEQSVDALLAGVSSSQNEKVDAMIRDTQVVESHRNQFTMLPVLYTVLVNLIKARRPQ